MINLEYKIWDIPTVKGSLFEMVKELRGDPNEQEIIDPFRLKDINAAALIILEAVETEQRIVVFGDYDVDGITASAIMMNYLEGIGADVYYKLPNRIEEGYGITEDAVLQLKEKGVNLIITVDNGISAQSAAQLAKDNDITFIITDHHQPPETLPCADAIVNPKRVDDDSGYDTLSGAGVALCLVAAMEGCSVNEILYEYAELAALGTVCDVMPLNRLNRTIVKAGLSVMNESPSEGIVAILTSAKQIEREVTSTTLGFTIGPRLNSAGRMEDPAAALALLLSSDEEECYYLAEKLEECNLERRNTELAVIEQLTIEAEKQNRSPILVLFADDIHEGVIGLAAARLMRSYSKPTIVISLSGDEGKGSGRSFDGFSLYDALCSCNELLIGFGGHTLAAGLSIKRENCERFREAINRYAVSAMSNSTLRRVTADGLITDSISINDVIALKAFEPFGQENRTPTFMVTDVVIEKVTAMKDQHCRICFVHKGEKYWATCFSRTPASLGYKAGDRIDLLLELSIYSSASGDNLSLLIKEIRPKEMSKRLCENVKLFSEYYYGRTLSCEEKNCLYPDRDFTAKVFRSIEGSSAIDMASFLCSFNPDDSGRVLSAILGLIELGFIYEKDGVILKTENPQKRSLDESSVIGGLAN